MKGIFLDDVRDPKDVTWFVYPDHIEWIIVRTYLDFVDAINELHQDAFETLLISFDHDLADFQEDNHGLINEKTGYHAVQYLVDYLIMKNIKHRPDVISHSQNPVGKRKIQDYYNSFLTIEKC